MFLDRKTVIKMPFFLNCQANLKQCESEGQRVVFFWGRWWERGKGVELDQMGHLCVFTTSFLYSDVLTSGASLSPAWRNILFQG